MAGEVARLAVDFDGVGDGGVGEGGGEDAGVGVLGWACRGGWGGGRSSNSVRESAVMLLRR